NWATGSYIQSFAAKAKLRRQRNVSVPGALVEDLPKQVSSLKSYDPTIVTILIGANNTCHGWFEPVLPGIRETLSLLGAKPKIFLSTVVDVTNLYQLKKDDFICRAKWDFTGWCPMIASEGSRDLLHRETVAINAAIMTLPTLFPNVTIVPIPAV